MSDEQVKPPPPTFSTDEILDVFEHVRQNEKGWLEHCAEHGMDAKALQRAIAADFPSGDGKLKIALAAFAFGLSFGAMRLEPVSYDPKEVADNCNCPLCQIRRAIEAQQGGEESS